VPIVNVNGTYLDFLCVNCIKSSTALMRCKMN
jgi:hypothetical protein